MSEALRVFPAGELGHEEALALFPPISRFRTGKGQFDDILSVCFEPYVQQELADPAGITSLEWGVCRGVDSFGQFVDQREEPCAVRVEQVGAHDEHVEHVTAGRGHTPIEHGNVFGSLRHEDVPHNVQMGSIERVRIVRAHRLDIVVPPTGHDCAGLFQRFPNLLAGCDSNESVFSQSVRETGGRKQPAVVHEAFVVGVAVLPHPIQGRQFGIACVEGRDVIALVISLNVG